MSKRALGASIVGVAVLSGVTFAQEMVPNWPAPALWSHPVREMAIEKQSGVGTEAVEAIEAVPTSPLHFWVSLPPAVGHAATGSPDSTDLPRCHRAFLAISCCRDNAGSVRRRKRYL